MPAIDHVRYLAETIGPRGSTTEPEARAADYAERLLAGKGLEVNNESFSSARSSWWPYALFSTLMLLAWAFHIFGGRSGAVLALALGVFSVASVLLELSFRQNPLRFLLPKGASRNISARIPSTRPARRQAVLVGHLDTHRTPLVFSSDSWLRFFRLLIPLGLISSLALLALFTVSIFSNNELGRLLSLPPGAFVAALVILTLQADLTPFTRGANDNASGAGVVLSLAERLAADPLLETEVWVVLTGCEEVGCYGAESFARAHREELEGAIWLTVDTVGGRETILAYLTQETFLLRTKSDLAMLNLADAIASEHPEWGARRHQIAGAFTEGAIGGKFGFPLLTFIALRHDGSVPEWHRPTDVIERIDEQAVARCEAFLSELLARIDKPLSSE